MLLGQREQDMPQGGSTFAHRFVGQFPGAVRDKLGQDVDVIARATVKAVDLAREGRAPSKYWVLEQADVVRLGRDEYKSGKETPAAS